MVGLITIPIAFDTILTSDNHLKCPRTYDAWSGYCPAITRKNQMIQRALAKETIRLYGSQASIDKYNKERETLPTFAEIRPNVFFKHV